jgi:hypothetical protein
MRFAGIHGGDITMGGIITMQAAGMITNGISKILAEHLLIFNTPPCRHPIFPSTFINCLSSPMSLATAAAALPHAYLGQGQGIILLPATCSKNTRNAVITIIEQRVTMGFPCPAYKARCLMTVQPPKQITMMQTGSISTSKSIVMGASHDVFFCTSDLCFFCKVHSYLLPPTPDFCYSYGFS